MISEIVKIFSNDSVTAASWGELLDQGLKIEYYNFNIKISIKTALNLVIKLVTKVYTACTYQGIFQLKNKPVSVFSGGQTI